MWFRKKDHSGNLGVVSIKHFAFSFQCFHSFVCPSHANDDLQSILCLNRKKTALILYLMTVAWTFRIIYISSYDKRLLFDLELGVQLMLHSVCHEDAVIYRSPWLLPWQMHIKVPGIFSSNFWIFFSWLNQMWESNREDEKGAVGRLWLIWGENSLEMVTLVPLALVFPIASPDVICAVICVWAMLNPGVWWALQANALSLQEIVNCRVLGRNEFSVSPNSRFNTFL